MERINHKSSAVLVIISIIIASLMVFSFGCAKKEEKEIKIGVIMPLSGNAAWLGEQHKWGIEIAVNEINATGGVNGSPLKIIYEDDKNSPLEGVNALNKILSSHKNIPVIMCMTSSTCMAIYKRVEENNIVLFANAGHPEIASLSNWVFRNFLTGLQEAKRMAEVCINDLGLKEVAVAYINDAYGESGFNVFKDTFSKSGGSISVSEKYDKDGTDFKTEITKLLAKKPKAIYILGYGNSTAILINQLKEFKYSGKLLGTNNFSGPPISTLANTALDGAIFTAPHFFSDKSSTKIAAFISKVRKKYGKEPQWNTVVEYDAIHIISNAMRKINQIDGNFLKKELLNIGNYEGIAGKYIYSPTKEWLMPLSVMTYKNNVQVPYVKIGS